MQAIHLFHTPGACSRVVMSALEEIGLDYTDEAINIFVGQQRSPRYLASNPKGKVPALKIGDELITENAAILIFLDEQFPKAALLPATLDAVKRAQNRSDLIWCSNTLHPIVRVLLMPARMSPNDPTGAREAAAAQLSAMMPAIAQRLAGGFWHGADWSITDVYLFWCLGVAATGGFDFSAYPEVAAHTARVRARPSFQRALAREQAALDRTDIRLPPGASL